METIGHYMCPVCGYPNLYRAPYRESGDPTYDFCESCGFQFGISGWDDELEDWDPHAFEKWRCKWIEAGTPWSSVAMKQPSDWNPQEQLAKAGFTCLKTETIQD